MRVNVRGWCLIVTHKPCIDQPWIYRITSCIDAVFRVTYMTSGRLEGRCEEAVPDKESWGPSCNILSTWTVTFSQDLPLRFCILPAIKKREAGTALERSYTVIWLLLSSLIFRPCAFVACSANLCRRPGLVHHVICATTMSRPFYWESMKS